MSDSTRLIKKYYHSVKSISLRSFVDQVDFITELMASIFESDFLAIYYKKDGNDHLIPVGFHANKELISSEFQLIEKEYCKISNKSEFLMQGLLSLEENQNSKTHKFANKNEFKYLYQFPFFKKNNISILVLAFWHNHPNYDESIIKKSIPFIFSLLDNILNSIEEHKIANDYTIRLSDLIALFEIDISEYNYSEFVDILIGKLNKIIPGGYLLFSSENQKPCKFYQAINIEKPNLKFIDDFENDLSDFSKELDSASSQNGIWVDFKQNFSSHYKTILVSPICIDIKRKTFLVYISDRISPLTDNDKQLLSLFSLFSILILKASLLLETEKRINKLLKKTSSKLADIETLAAITDLTTGVAHEFNNMIGGIVGRVQLLKLKDLDPDVISKLDKIEHIALEGANTVKRIQEFSSGVKYKKTENFDLVMLIEAFISKQDCKWNQSAKEKYISIVTNIELGSAYISGIYDDLTLALNNIVENGVEYAKEHSTVTISLSDDSNHIYLSVRNEGIEINQADLKRIFYPFFSKKNAYGAGMGLSIVHGIITRHGGNISVSSSEEEGTIFVIEFLKTDAVIEESDISRKINILKQLKILVVDDDEQIREVLVDMLSIDGYDTVACEDGLSALAAFDESEFDLVITDLGMPGMSGLELAGEIHSKAPDIPIAMITGWGTQLNHDEVALKGIKTVMSKPFHLKDIKTMISELVESSSQL